MPGEGEDRGELGAVGVGLGVGDVALFWGGTVNSTPGVQHRGGDGAGLASCTG